MRCVGVNFFPQHAVAAEWKDEELLAVESENIVATAHESFTAGQQPTDLASQMHAVFLPAFR